MVFSAVIDGAVPPGPRHVGRQHRQLRPRLLREQQRRDLRRVRRRDGGVLRGTPQADQGHPERQRPAGVRPAGDPVGDVSGRRRRHLRHRRHQRRHTRCVRRRGPRPPADQQRRDRRGERHVRPDLGDLQRWIVCRHLHHVDRPVDPGRSDAPPHVHVDTARPRRSGDELAQPGGRRRIPLDDDHGDGLRVRASRQHRSDAKSGTPTPIGRGRTP